MKNTKLLIAGVVLSTTLAMAGTTDNKDFTMMKTKCTGVVSTALDCMNKATKPMEMKVCKMEMKKSFLEMKIEKMKSGKMMKGKGMGKGKCGNGKCGGGK